MENEVFKSSNYLWFIMVFLHVLRLTILLLFISQGLICYSQTGGGGCRKHAVGPYGYNRLVIGNCITPLVIGRSSIADKLLVNCWSSAYELFLNRSSTAHQSLLKRFSFAHFLFINR